MKRALAVLVILVLPLVGGAPVPSADIPGEVSLAIDTRYSSTDSDSSSISVAIRNTGNQTLQINGLGSTSGVGTTVTCANNCGTSTISPGRSRSVSLLVSANEQASEGLQTVHYPVTFSNADSISVPVGIRINKLEPGRLEYFIDIRQPNLSCPAPGTITVSGALTLRNVGDTSIYSAATSLSGPTWVSLSSTPPSSLSVGDSRTVQFTMAIPARSLPPLLTVTASGQYTSRESRSAYSSGSIALAPPTQFEIQSSYGSGNDIHVDPPVLGILEPFKIPLTLREGCGYQGVTVAAPAGDGAATFSPPGPWQVGAGQSSAATLTVTLPLAKVNLLCTGYSNSLAFIATGAGNTKTGTLTIEAPVDMAGTRQALQTLAGAQSTNLPTDLKNRAAELGNRFSALLGSGNCGQSTHSVRDVLAAAPPLAWAFNLTKTVQSSRANENVETFLAMGAMAVNLPDLCNGLASQDVRDACNGFADAYRSYSNQKIGEAIQDAEGRHGAARAGERVVLESFLATAHQRVGHSTEAAKWQKDSDSSRTRLNDIRSQSIQRYSGQQERDQSWLRNPSTPTAGDFRVLDPATFLVIEARYAAAHSEYAGAAELASDAGDTALANTIGESAAKLADAHQAARLNNYLVLGLWGTAVVAAFVLATTRAIGWVGQSKRARLGDIVLSA